MQLSGNDQEDIAWIEDIDFTVDDCLSEVFEYSERRKDDPPSDPSVSEWIDRHPQAAGNRSEAEDESLGGDFDDKSMPFSNALDDTVVEKSLSLGGLPMGQTNEG